MVACHNFDLDAARGEGYRTAFVRRPQEWGSAGPPDPTPNPACDIVVDGFAEFADRADQRVFYHTEIDPAYGGRGLATILVEEALNGARDEGKRVVPACSMVVTVLKKHPEFDDITDRVTPDVLRWAETQPTS